MNVPFQVKVPVDVAIDLKERLRVLQIAHGREVEALDKKRRNGVDPSKLAGQYEELALRGRTLTLSNMLRVAIAHGAANVVLMKDDQIFKHLVESGIVSGRPKSHVRLDS